MTPAEIVEALCEEVLEVERCLEGTYELSAGDMRDAIARRDRIKAALVGCLSDYAAWGADDHDEGVEKRWRKLEEACRGE